MRRNVNVIRYINNREFEKEAQDGEEEEENVNDSDSIYNMEW